MERSNDSPKEEIRLRGIGVSPGVVIGPAFLMHPESLNVEERKISKADVEPEICRLENALIETRRQLRDLQLDIEKRAEMSDASILDAHLMVLDDRAVMEEIIHGVETRLINVEAVIRDVCERYAKVLSSIRDDYLRERVADVRDVARRIIRNLRGHAAVPVSGGQVKQIMIAHDLAPSDTASLRRNMVLGFATDMGSPTSHTAVMARALELPAVVALSDITSKVSDGDEILIDGNRGVLIIHPSSDSLEMYGKLKEARRVIEKGLSHLRDQPAETRDHHRIVLSANVEGVEELDAVKEYGAQGIGLFRSEFVCLSERKLLDENEQAVLYSEVAERLAPDSVIIRTLDLGGDKFLPDLPGGREANPFLGCRSIRISLMYPDRFKKQLRAILRASHKGNVKVMYPMITNAEEIVRANEILEQAKAELLSEGVEFDHDIEVGAMIEIPCAALTADELAKHVRFFSIGTNDLTQYTLAVDRINERVAYLYEPTHPAVLQLISRTIEAGHRNGIWVGLCGEMAADPVVSGLLVGMGIDELSVAPAAIPPVKDAIRNLTYSRARELAAEALACRSAKDVLRICRQALKESDPEIYELVQSGEL